jgi:hypothetical protein
MSKGDRRTRRSKLFNSAHGKSCSRRINRTVRRKKRSR